MLDKLPAIIGAIIGSVLTLGAIRWPFHHDSHDCLPVSEWKGRICPLAEKYEVIMFLQIIIGLSIVVFFAQGLR